MGARFAAAALTMLLAAAVAAGVAALSRSAPEHPAPASVPLSDGGSAGPRAVSMTALDNLTFSATTITAAPDELLTVSVRTVSGLPREVAHHNFVLLQADAPVDEFVRLAAQSHAHAQHIPAALQNTVIAATDIAGAGETVSTTFRAPATPGSYTFLCSVPGHFAGGMKGVLIVR